MLRRIGRLFAGGVVAGLAFWTFKVLRAGREVQIGRIEAKSCPGEGTHMSLVLPLLSDTGQVR